MQTRVLISYRSHEPYWQVQTKPHSWSRWDWLRNPNGVPRCFASEEQATLVASRIAKSGQLDNHIVWESQ
jgi:hypothetical protein